MKLANMPSKKFAMCVSLARYSRVGTCRASISNGTELDKKNKTTRGNEKLTSIVAPKGQVRALAPKVQRKQD